MVDVKSEQGGAFFHICYFLYQPHPPPPSPSGEGGKTANGKLGGEVIQLFFTEYSGNVFLMD